MGLEKGDIYAGAVCMSIKVVGNTTDLSLSDPYCNTDACLAFKKAHAASQKAVSYTHQFDYGHYTVWYCLAILGICTLSHGIFLIKIRYRPGPLGALSVPVHKVLACYRSITYRFVGGATAARLKFPTLGGLILGLFTLLFFLLLTFLEHPYYRERRGYGSPPLAVRTGLMSTALIPFIVALSGKVNVVTFLTGISHEKLNIFHRWASYLCLFLAVVHTIPFIATALKNCGADGVRAQFYKPGSFEYTGVPSLGMLVGLCLLSIPIIRQWFYNFFFRIHIPLYISFLGLMVWHSGNEMDSWTYLWATLAVWLFQVVARLFTKWQTFHIRRNWFSGFPAMVKTLPGDIVQVTLLVPKNLQWTPGQHCWLRMPHLSLLQNHPFTIVNLPDRTLNAKLDSQGVVLHDMQFYIKAYSGLTRDLFASVLSDDDRSLSIHIDGPYGGLVTDATSQYTSLLFVCGGGGISACMPHILHAADASRQGSGMVEYVHLIWIVRSIDHTTWISERLEEISGSVKSGFLRVDFYITGNLQPFNGTPGVYNSICSIVGKKATPYAEKTNIETTREEKPEPAMRIVHYGRPYLPGVLPSLLQSRRTFIFGCGPEGLLLDLGDATAAAQTKVLRGTADIISLHTESFGW